MTVAATESWTGGWVPGPAEPGRTTSIYLTAEEWRALQAAVEATGVSQSAILRVGLRRLLGLPRVSSSRVESILDGLADQT